MGVNIINKYNGGGVRGCIEGGVLRGYIQGAHLTEENERGEVGNRARASGRR